MSSNPSSETHLLCDWERVSDFSVALFLVGEIQPNASLQVRRDTAGACAGVITPSSLGLEIRLIPPMESFADGGPFSCGDPLVSLWPWEVKRIECHFHLRDRTTEVKRNACSVSN